MPTPRAGTVTEDLARAVREVKGGRVEFKVERPSTLHVLVGKMSFSAEQLWKNAPAPITAVMKAKPDSAKGTYLVSAHVSATMSPSVALDLKELAKLG